MARVGESIENGSGERVVWLQTRESSGGEVVAMDVLLQPGTPSPPRHIHLHQEERFHIVSGAVALEAGGERRLLSAGEEAVIPAGVAHTWAPAGEEPIRLQVELRPALHFEELQEAIFWLVRNGKMNGRRLSNLLQVVTVFHHHLDEARAASPPALVQRVLLSTLAAIGRRAGYTPNPATTHADTVTAPAADADSASGHSPDRAPA